MRKFKVFADFKEEEAYLNEMAKKGYFLKKHSAFGFYHFTEGTPEELYYHVDYRKFKTQADFEDYLALFEDAGWRHVYGTKNSLNQYFLPKDGNADDDIFSTKDSAALRYKHLNKICYANVTVAIAYFIAVLIIYDFSLANIGFLTQGLWEMTGTLFWMAFFFELPFVLFRTAPVVLSLVMGIAYAVWGSKAKRIYSKMMEDEK
ncbi:DUF2812 domain-containing protein [Desulfosporosinus lacus]|uniref:DUF2812 domain-containing protein n=1 Tax=Desulfosporosinus lacus DSM 15449 TaxID=1121420 RepID=A0A1M5XAY7_9FIRM|nr:DUF2812 domain-containing protein [Desulfosporosinus lacus]SHH96363.1 Protein of unknown function [Desulfosporosinus lacus DSM 15449]